MACAASRAARHGIHCGFHACETAISGNAHVPWLRLGSRGRSPWYTKDLLCRSASTSVGEGGQEGEAAGRAEAEKNLPVLRTRKQYTAMMQKCSKVGDVQRAELWFTELTSTPDRRPDLKMFNTLLDACANGGDLTTAERVLASMSDWDIRPDVYSYCAVIRACESSDMGVQRAEGHFQDMLNAGEWPSMIVYNAMISVCASVGDVAGAEHWFDELVASGFQPDVISYNSMLDACAKAADKDKVSTWFSTMTDAGVRPDSFTYASLVRVCIAVGDTEEAERRLADAIRGGASSLVLYNSLIDSYGKRDNVKGAEAVFEKLQSQQLRPNQNTYNAMLKAYAHSSNIDAKELRATVRRWLPLMRRNGCPPDVVSYTTIIAGFVRRGDLRRAEELYGKMKEAGVKPNAVTFTELIRGCAKVFDLEGAHRHMASMGELGLVPSRVVFNALINLHNTVRQPAGAEQALRNMLSEKVAPDLLSYTTVVKAAARAGDLARAEAWLPRLIEAGVGQPDGRVYYALLTGCAQVGDIEAADRIVARMRDEDGIPEDVISHSILLGVCATAADLPEAEKRFLKMREADVKPNEYTLNQMVNVCVAAGDPFAGERWFLESIRLGAKAEIVGFNSLLRAWAASGEYHRTKLWFNRISAASVTPDVISNNARLNACAAVGDSERAQAIFERMAAKKLKPSLASYRALVKPLAKDGEYETISQILYRMEGSGMPRDARCVRALISACANANPPAAREAEEAFRTVADELRGDAVALQFLARAVSGHRFRRLSDEFGFQRPASLRVEDTHGGVSTTDSPAVKAGARRLGAIFTLAEESAALDRSSLVVAQERGLAQSGGISSLPEGKKETPAAAFKLTRSPGRLIAESAPPLMAARKKQPAGRFLLVDAEAAAPVPLARSSPQHAPGKMPPAFASLRRDARVPHASPDAS